MYVRDGDRWKAAFDAEAVVVDPAAPRAKPVARKVGSPEKQTKPIDRDAHTDALLALEMTVWEAWKVHDAKRLVGLTAKKLQIINILGIHFASKAEALKNWSGEGCDMKSVAPTDAAATMLSPTRENSRLPFHSAHSAKATFSR